MKTFRVSILVFLATSFCVVTVVTSQTQEKKPTEYGQLLDQLVHLRADETKVAKVTTLTLQRDVGKFTLSNGQLYLCQPVNRRVIAAMFVGDGMFSMKPPTKIEQDQLTRFLEKDSLEERFTYLFLMFCDTTFEQLNRKAVFLKSDIPREVHTQINDALRELGEEDKATFDTGIMTSLLHNDRNSTFIARFRDGTRVPFFFRVDPFAEEEISLSHRPFSFVRQYHENISQFHTQEEYRLQKAGADEDKDIVRVNEYRIESHISNSLDFSASASLTFTSLTKNLRWVQFALYDDLIADSVLYAKGVHAPFVKGKESYDLWVQCPAPLVKDQRCSLQVYYHGDLLERGYTGTTVSDIDLSRLVYIKSPNYWYPRAGYRELASYDLTFRISDKYKLASVGELIETRTNDDETILRWKTKSPIRGASFNIGIFDEEILERKDIPRITLLAERGARHLSTKKEIDNETGETTKGSAVIVDVSSSAQFYHNVFGKADVSQLYTTEIPFMHGEAFPGLVHLPWFSYQDVDLVKRMGSGTWIPLNEVDQLEIRELMRSHEVAHQWWGIGVDFRTYHDQWLSEGFSTFSSLWYMQTSLRNNKLYFKVLEDWRKKILQSRKYLFGSGQEAGPIWLGYRTQSSNTPDDYSLIIYRKGGWVLHMLRNMMIDLKTMNEDKFKNMMREFYSTYLGKKATTLDFQHMVEKHIGGDMTWFFNQWVMDTKVLEYTFAFKSEKTPEGKFKVTFRVRQENVSKDFRMIVPLLVKFDSDKFIRLRILVSGDKEEQELPLLPFEPEEIIFNDLSSVLCEVDYEKWK